MSAAYADLFSSPNLIDEQETRYAKPAIEPPPMDYARARNTDPPTSHAAARKAVKAMLDHRACILGVMWRPMTSYRIAELTGLTQVQVARRMSELVAANLVRALEQTAPGGPSGNQCTLWERVIA